jgi:DNA-binding beta-propeller fold protein YncE
VATAPSGVVYAGDIWNHRVQYFTPTGSFLGTWGSRGSGNGEFNVVTGVAYATGARIYVVGWNHRVQYFTTSGSFLGKWGSHGSGDGKFNYPSDVAVAPCGYVYVADEENWRIQYFTADGSFLGKWGSFGSGPGQIKNVGSLAVAANGNVYVADSPNSRVQYFTSTGSFLGMWTTNVNGVAIAPRGDVYTTWGPGVRYFTPTGSFLGSFGTKGMGNGQFKAPWGMAFSPMGSRIYVADCNNFRIQYFNRNEPAVSPASLGRVKALFR